MRNLKTKDLFTLSKIVKRMNVKEDIKKLTKNITGLNDKQKTEAEESMKIDLTMLFVENIGNAEKECYKLFADLTDKKPEDIENLDLKDFISLVTEMFSQDGIGNFLSSAFK